MVSAAATITSQQLENTSSSTVSASSRSSSALSPCCCDECGRVKKDMKNVRDELRFLTHQVSQLMHIFSIKYCQCEECAQRICSLDNTSNGATNGHANDDSDNNSRKTSNTDQPTNQRSIKTEPIPVLEEFQSRKRAHPESIINVDQLLPKLLAKNGSIESPLEPVKLASPASQASVTTSGDEADDEKSPASQNAHAFFNDCPPPLTKVPRYDFAHIAYNLTEKRPLSTFEQSTFLTRHLSTSSLGVTGVELPKNCVDGLDVHMENRYVNSNGLLPTVPSTIFLRNDEERHYMKAFPPALPTVTGPGLPLVSYGPKSSTFFCGVCKREFSNVYYKRHMIVHANARPHVCDVCGKRFNERSNMMKHRQRLHVP